MKKFKTKKIFLIAISLVLLFTLTACDNFGEYDSIAIKEVIGIQNIEVEHGTPVGDVIAKLASKVDVVFTDDSKEEDINVSWDAPSNYDPDVLGDYIFTGTFRVEKTFETVTRDAVVSIGEKVSSVEELDDITVDYGTTIADIDFPEEVEVTLSDASVVTGVGVNDWAPKLGYDPLLNGGYIFEGILDVEGKDFTNPDEIKAEVKVVVDQAEPAEVVAVTNPSDIIVPFDTDFADIGLPNVVTATLDNGNDVTVPVNWSGTYDGKTEAKYTLEGTLDVSGYPDINNTGGHRAYVDVFVEEEVVPAEVVTVTNPNKITVPYNTGFDYIGLPNEVHATLDNGNSLNVPVSWDDTNYDETPADVYTLEGTLDVSGFPGINNTNNVMASVDVEVSAEAVPAEVVTVTNPDGINVTFGTNFVDIDLPNEVKATLDNGNSLNVPIDTWNCSAYDGETEGIYTATGTIDVSSFPGIENSAGVEAEIVLTVEIAEVVTVTNPEGITVPHGTLFDDIELPNEVHATLDNSDSLNVPVTWTCSAYDGETEGIYTATGTIDVSVFPGIENPDDVEAEMNITVGDEVLTGFFKGELLKIYDDGKKLKINATDYNQSPTTIDNGEVVPLFTTPSEIILDVAGTPGLKGYLDQMSAVDHAILGSTVEVEVIDDEVVQLLSILLESKEYTHTEINDILQSRDGYYGLTVNYEEPGSNSTVTGDTVEITMPQLTLGYINFKNLDTYVLADDVTFNDVEVNGEILGIGGYGFEGDFSAITVDEVLYIGDVFSEFGSFVTTLDILPDNPGRDSIIDVDGDITGNVKVDASGSTITANSITGDLEVTENGTNATINVSTIGGSVILGSEVTSLDITDVNGDLTIGYDGALIEDIHVHGDLIIEGDNVTINNVNVDGNMIINGSNATINESNPYVTLAGDLTINGNGADIRYMEIGGATTENGDNAYFWGVRFYGPLELNTTGSPAARLFCGQIHGTVNYVKGSYFNSVKFYSAQEVNVNAEFIFSKFYRDLTINNVSALFDKNEFYTDSNQINVYVETDNVLDGLVVAGANDFKVVVAENQEVTFDDEIDFTGLPSSDFIIDVTASGASYVNDATWTPEFAQVVIEGIPLLIGGSPRAYENGSNDLMIVMEYDKLLYNTDLPAPSQFEAFINSGSLGNPSTVGIWDNSVFLNMGSNSYLSTDTFTLSYSKNTNNIQDIDGKEARELIVKEVVNDLP